MKETNAVELTTSELATSELTTGGETIEATLEGGPATLPQARRRVRIARETEVMKVPHYGGYEHFVRAQAAVPDNGPVPFFWSARTHVAE